ncbi:MAG TPA: tetratricopeptide repeat protein [Tepidisphaeraceae bacterium]|jgi:superkiller protein 3
MKQNRTFHRLILTGAILAGGCASNTAGPATGTQQSVQQYVQGVQALKRGDTNAAVNQLEAAITSNPDLRMARTVLGQIYRDRGDYTNAVRQYQALARLDPYTLSNHYYLGVSYQFLRQYADAVRAYVAGLAIDPLDFKLNMNVGTVLLATGDVDGAIKYLDKATQLDPKSAAAWSNLGVALDARGSYVFAETAYRRAIGLETNAPSVVQNLANNLLMQQKVGEATYLWETIVKQRPTPFNRTRLAEAYTQGGDLKAAEEIVNGVLQADSRFVPGLNAKARMLIRQYELSGFTDETARTAGVATLRQSLGLNGQQPQITQLLRKYSQALPLSQ